MKCQRCSSDRILTTNSKSSDLNNFEYAGVESSPYSYVPYGLNIGGGDYIELEICLECGQLQGEWPAKDPELKEAKDAY